jgi:hypothetical protein
MIKNKLVTALKNKISGKPKKDALQTATKKEPPKRLSTQEFLKGYDSIYQAGPKIKYQNPGSMEKESQLIKENQSLF